MNLKINIAYLFLFLSVLFWAGNFIVGKYASYYQIPPFSLNFYRWFFAWLILLPFTYKEIISKKNYILENYKFYILLGITSVTIFNSIVYYSLNFTQVISGVLMISTIPVMIMFISSILKIEKTNIFQILGVICSFIGVILIITPVKESITPIIWKIFVFSIFKIDEKNIIITGIVDIIKTPLIT